MCLSPITVVKKIYGPRQANLVLIAYASSESSGEPAHPRSQSRQNLRCSLIQAVSQEEHSDRKPDPWPLWMAGHAQLKFVLKECSKTQIRLAGLNLYYRRFIFSCLMWSWWQGRDTLTLERLRRWGKSHVVPSVHRLIAYIVAFVSEKESELLHVWRQTREWRSSF